MGLKVINTSHSPFFNCSAGMNYRWHPEISEKKPCCLPFGKAGELQILCCQGFAVNDYSFTLDALTLKPSGFCNVRVHLTNRNDRLSGIAFDAISQVIEVVFPLQSKRFFCILNKIYV